jgi:hypothetical protein
MTEPESRKQFADALRQLGSARNPAKMRVVDWVVRGLIAINVALLILTFVPAFSGTGAKPGMADRLWGDYRYGGFRGDVVWICVSTIVILVGGLRPTDGPGAERTTSNLCVLWLPCFLSYLLYVLVHMF